MPYIAEDKREMVEPHLEILDNAGDLNFCLTKVCDYYMQKHGRRYQTMNDIVGALEGCKLEFYRRIVADYEDEKLEENGDVYGA